MNTEHTPEKKITLQKATTADIEAYIAMERRVVDRTYSAMLTEEEVREEMQKGPVYMIKDGDVIVGSVSYEIKPEGTVYLSGLVIDPAYQGRGLGRTALEQVLEEVKDAPKIELLTHPDNTKAVGLYQSLGFQITGRKENAFGDGEPRVILTREKPKDEK